MQFLQAKHYHPGDNDNPTRIVIHRMEAPEKGDTAESVANYFHTTDRVASAHYCIDNNSIVQCVKDTDVAYHAPPNYHSIGLEHAGYSADNDWQNNYNIAMLEISAKLSAQLCRQYNLPIVWLSIQDLKDGKRGITSHANVSKAFGKSTHTDPGLYFPAADYLRLVKKYYQPQEVKPMENITFNGPVVAHLKAPNGGVWLLTDVGSIYAFECPAYGDPYGETYWGSRKAAQLLANDNGYTVVATTGEKYDYK